MLASLVMGNPARALEPIVDVPASTDAAQSLMFDIPALPLGEALDRYAEVTGLPAVFPSELTDGRTSSPLQGRLRPEIALRTLLQGTGLVATQRESRLGRTFVLEHARAVAAQVASGSPPAGSLFAGRAYAGLAQARIWQQLCADPRTRPGSYTALLRFRLGSDGRLHGARLLGSSGDEGRDAALLRRLDRVRIERTAGGAMADEELTMVVFPSDPGGPQCRETQGKHDG